MMPREVENKVRAWAGLIVCTVLAACANGPAVDREATETAAVPVTSTTAPTTSAAAPPTTAAPTTAAATIATTTNAPTSPAPTAAATPPPTTGAAPTAAPADGEQPAPGAIARTLVGTSVDGREIVADAYGTPGGRPVLIIGVIHGNEDAGVKIVDRLRSVAVPDGNELWLIESMNPDGQAAQIRQNARQVDLNRNFPYGWEPLGAPGDGQYAGVGPASEPETQAMVAFITALRPEIVIWYHQDLDVISPAKGRPGQIRARYAELTGMRLAEFSTSGARYTGIAATWARRELADIEAATFIVELGPTLDDAQAQRHADAIATIMAEF